MGTPTDAEAAWTIDRMKYAILKTKGIPVRTDAALAAEMGVARSNVAAWRRRGSVPLSVLKRFAVTFGYPVAELFPASSAARPTKASVKSELMDLAATNIGNLRPLELLEIFAFVTGFLTCAAHDTGHAPGAKALNVLVDNLNAGLEAARRIDKRHREAACGEGGQ